MVDDGEIKKLIRKESETFLRHALFLAKGGEGDYDFEAEFAKTRRNKSFVAIGVALATIICLIGASFAVTRSIENRAAAVPVSVSAFEDLNLRDLLDASKRDDAALGSAKLRLAQMGAELNSGLEFADREYRSSLEAIGTLGPAPDIAAARIADAAAVRAAVKKKLLADYSAAAAESRAQIAAAQARIDLYDTRSLAKAKKEQAVLENARLAFDIEKSQLIRLYESRIGALEASRKREIAALVRQKDELAAALTARYNPTFADDRSAGPLSDRTAGLESSLTPFDPYLGPAGILDSSAGAALDSSYSDLEYFAAKLRAVPYINSVPTALSRMELEAKSSFGAYRAALQSAASGLKARDEANASLAARAGAAEGSFDRYRSAMAANARESRVSGYVLDAQGGIAFLVFLDPSLSVAEGSVGSVVRDGKVLATVAISLQGGDNYARVTKLAGRAKIRAFDSILIDAQK